MIIERERESKGEREEEEEENGTTIIAEFNCEVITSKGLIQHEKIAALII